MLTNDREISAYMGLDKVKNKGLPLICAATTSGTGSEATVFTIITDTSTDVKMLIGSSYLMPQVAIADPLMTVSMPRALTAATGIDALCHAVEAYVSLKACPMSDIFALSAIELLVGNLRQAWANGNNLEARDKVMMGALKAGVGGFYKFFCYPCSWNVKANRSKFPCISRSFKCSSLKYCHGI